MRINNSQVDILESEILGSLNKKAIRGKSYYTPISSISFAADLDEETGLKHGCITFDELAELDKFINDMLMLRATAIKARGYYDIHNDPLSPIEDYIHAVVNKDIGHIMYDLEKIKKEVGENKNEQKR